MQHLIINCIQLQNISKFARFSCIYLLLYHMAAQWVENLINVSVKVFSANIVSRMEQHYFHVAVWAGNSTFIIFLTKLSFSVNWL